MKRYFLFLIIFNWLLLAGCAAGRTAPESNSPASSPGSSDTPLATPAPTPITAPLPTTFAGGQNEDGTYFRGRADAPITLVEYSDFL